MAKVTRGNSNAVVEALVDALTEYEKGHPGADAALYQQSPGAVRIRIIDERFAGMPRSRRHDDIWQFLTARVAPDMMSDISALVLLPTAELRSSLTNLEFEDPSPSGL